jgi:hypothetical protein
VAVSIVMALYGVLMLVANVPPFSVGAPLGMVLLTASVGLAMLFVAWGLFSLRAWAWIVTVGLEIIDGLFALVRVADGPRSLAPWLSLAVAATIVVYLTRPNVRRVFMIPEHRVTPPGVDRF